MQHVVVVRARCCPAIAAYSCGRSSRPAVHHITSGSSSAAMWPWRQQPVWPLPQPQPHLLLQTQRAASTSCVAAAAAAGWPLQPQQHLLQTRRSASTSRVAAGKSGGGSSPLQRSLRAMPIRIVRVSKDSSSTQAAAAAEWLEKLRRYTAVTEVLVRSNPKNASSPAAQKQAEAEKVLKAVGAGERLILLDERGRDVSSEDVARLLLAASDDGVGLAFCVGGPFGHGPAVVERADESIRLSRMVLNHSVAHIVLAEQLYRAWTIVRGEPYHH